MPILAENKHRYPYNWGEIREQILKRAKNRCEFCGVDNHKYIVRYSDEDYEVFDEYMEAIDRAAEIEWNDPDVYIKKIPKIVLTIAHLDHAPENNDPKNLKALCQRCHNRYDGKHRAETRSIRKDKNIGQLRLL